MAGGFVSPVVVVAGFVVFGAVLVLLLGLLLGLLLPGAVFTRVSVLVAVPALGLTDWPAVVPPPAVEPVPPVGAAF